ncbi:MAG: serine/threonine protein kinase, partial [Planctomycetes bacterium]|nr:serine/threonine protein kinase [Planctomycetota bacterium]
MLTSTNTGFNAPITQGRDQTSCKCKYLLRKHQEVIGGSSIQWTTHFRLHRQLGSGGQGVVYLSECRGTDGFTLPIAIKVFSPDRYDDVRAYDEAMRRIADVAAHVAQIQHDNLLDVHDFIDRDRIRMMLMEWVDGYDLEKLLVPERLSGVEGRVSRSRWEYINRVLVTAGP